MNGKIKRLLRNEKSSYIYPFLWMHGEDEQTLRRYVNVIHEAGMAEFCVESRPHPDFAGAKWWRDMDIILDEARRRDMKVWILDDSHFPTGYANGALKDCDPKLCRQSIVRKVIPCGKSGGEVTVGQDILCAVPEWEPTLMEQYETKEHMRKFDDDRLLGAVAVREGGNGFSDLVPLKAESNNLTFTVPEGKWNIVLLYLTRNRGPHRDYINMMNPDSCRLLIDAVYEPHYDRYAAEFGKTIAGFFSDEPEIGNGHLYEYGKRLSENEDQAWSEQLQKVLQEKWGENFMRFLPLLWEEILPTNTRQRRAVIIWRT